jgi:hypothetical protein
MSQKTSSSKVLSPQSSSCNAKPVTEDSENDVAVGTYESDMVKIKQFILCVANT